MTAPTQSDLVGASKGILDAGVKDSTLLVVLVLALVAFVSFILYMKYYIPSLLARLTLSEKIEEHKANQVMGIQLMAGDLKDTATNLRDALELTHKHLDRSCPGNSLRPGKVG